MKSVVARASAQDFNSEAVADNGRAALRRGRGPEVRGHNVPRDLTLRRTMLARRNCDHTLAMQKDLITAGETKPLQY
jgi:hypothetical protein